VLGNSGVADLGLEVVDAEVVRVRLRDAQRRHVVAPGVARRWERHRVHRRGRRHERHPRQVLMHAGEHHRRRRDAAAHPHHLFDLVRVSGGHWPVVVWFAWPGVEGAADWLTDLYLQLQRLEVLDGLVQHRRLVGLVTVRYELLQRSHLLVDPVSSPLQHPNFNVTKQDY
jgi:hypothetical protein